jgi:hypothetical protein
MGYLNTRPDDDYNLQTMGQGGNVTTELPGASGLQGLLTTVPKALTAAGAAVGGLAQDALKDTPVGESVSNAVGGIDALNSSMKSLLGYETMPEFDPQSRAAANAATTVMQQWSATGEDPRVTGTLGRTVFGPIKALGIVAGAAPVVGPWGAAALYGSTEARGSYQADIAAGIDPTTAAEKATVAGAVGFGGAALPIGGSTLAAKIAAGVAGNVGLDIAGRTASWGVLKANGYDAQASQQKIFDGQSIMADIIMGAAFGAHSHFTGGHAIKPAEVNPADVDTSAAVLAQGQFEHSAPGVPVDPAAANAHVRVMSEALDSVANGDSPNVSAEDAKTLAEGTLPDPVHDTAAQITEAAHAELPGFTDAVAPIKEFTPPEFVNTRGEQRFHGTSKSIPGDMPSNDYALTGDNRNIFGQGFYTTDAADVAAGYMRKGAGVDPTLYQVKEKPGTNLYDMEAPITPKVQAIAKDVFGDLLPTHDLNNNPITNLRSMYNEFRAESSNNDLSRDDVQEIFDSFRYRLEQEGYHGLRHMGAVNSAKYAPHEVRIYWTPEDHASVVRDDLSKYQIRPEGPPLGQIPPDAEGKPAPAQFDDITQQRIDRLTSKYGDLQITDDNGETQSVSQVAKQMQNEMADADNLGKAHEAAAACFMSTGGAA